MGPWERPMLTRIEIDGFKSYEGFELDLSPHVVILGANGVGKSNLFDALHFLSALGQGSVADAARGLRGTPEQLFSFDAEGQPRTAMSFAVEVLVPPDLVDDFENRVTLKNTRLRYEVELARRPNDAGFEEIVVARESLWPIAPTDDRWRPGGRRPGRAFAEAFIRTSRAGRAAGYLTCSDATFHLHQEGRQGRTRTLSAARAHATAVSTVTSGEDFPHVYAFRRELASWRFLQLDPAAIRDPNLTSWNPDLEADGRNLGRVLDRIRRETQSDDQPDGALTDIAADLRQLVDGVTGLDVQPDPQTRDFRISLRIGTQGVPYSSHLVSDGTLRALALCAVFNDPKASGVLFMEQPEDGMHPARLTSLFESLRAHTSDPSAAAFGPLQQVITNSHSPVLLGAAKGRVAEALIADSVSRRSGAGAVRRTRIRPVILDDQGDMPPSEHVGLFEVDRILRTVLGGT
jgi:predicted ATPase